MKKSAKQMGIELGGLGAKEVNTLLKKKGYLEGTPGNYYQTKKGTKHGEVRYCDNGYGGYAARGWQFYLWDEKVLQDLRRDITFHHILLRIQIFLGHLLSCLEEVFFIGLIASIAASIIGKYNPDNILEEIKSAVLFELNYQNILKSFLTISILCYPVSLLVSIIIQKAGFYDGQFKSKSVMSILIFDLYNDLIFPVYLLSRPNRAFTKANNVIAVISKLLYFIVFWLFPVSFVLFGIIKVL